MHVILCSVSSAVNNDERIPALVHFGLKANITASPVYASYIKEDKKIRITQNGKETREVRAFKSGPGSEHYLCVKKLISEMEKDDIMFAEKISDFGDTAAEACDIYFSLIRKEIPVSFYECTYLDTDVLKLPVAPSEEAQMMVSRMIDNFFGQNGGTPRISIQERSRILEMKRAKKKSADSECP